MRFLYIVLLVFISSLSLGQQVSNVRASLDGNNVVIQYDLSGSSDQTYKVELFSSHDSYTTPLRRVSGDIGQEVNPGLDKRIVWEAKQELRVFSGDIQFEIRAEVLFEPLRVTSPAAGGIYKGGKNLPVTWVGGNSGDRLTIDIMREGRVYRSLGSVTNTGSYNWAIPNKMDKSDGYTIRLSSDQANQSPVSSKGFTMKKKGSLLVPVVIGVAVAAVAVVLLLPKDDKIEPPVGDSDLPMPPDPPGG